MPFLVMRYVAGQSLQTRVDHDGPLPVAEILRIGVQMAAGLSAAHAQGVIHRDIKPSNILLENTVERVLLTDFGLARAADDASLTQTGILAGTPHYMSLEQAGGEVVDIRSDLFSLGSVLYFTATGRPPFRAKRAMAVLNRICHEPHRAVWEVNAEIPDELCEIIDRLLEKKPRARFSDAVHVQSALSELLATVQLPGRRRIRSKVKRWMRRRRKVLAGAAGLLCCALIAAAAFLPNDGQEDASAESDVSPGADTEQAEAEQIRSAIAGEQRLERNFVDEITAVQTALRDLEAAHTYDGSQSLNEADAWSAEISDLQRRLSAVEDSLVIPDLKNGDQE
jgi:serine/threonine protein kinase